MQARFYGGPQDGAYLELPNDPPTVMNFPVIGQLTAAKVTNIPDMLPMQVAVYERRNGHNGYVYIYRYAR
jgi:hypothetical protein